MRANPIGTIFIQARSLIFISIPYTMASRTPKSAPDSVGSIEDLCRTTGFGYDSRGRYDIMPWCCSVTTRLGGTRNQIVADFSSINLDYVCSACSKVISLSGIGKHPSLCTQAYDDLVHVASPSIIVNVVDRVSKKAGASRRSQKNDVNKPTKGGHPAGKPRTLSSMVSLSYHVSWRVSKACICVFA